MSKEKQPQHEELQEAIPELSFKVPEYPVYSYGPIWYAGLFVALSVVIVGAILQRDYRLAVIIVLASILMYYLALAKPGMIEARVDSKGLTFKGKFYPWSVFHSFSIISSKTHPALHFDKLTSFSGPLVVPLPSPKKVAIKGAPRDEEPVTEDSLFVAVVNVFLPLRLHGRQTLADYISKLARF